MRAARRERERGNAQRIAAVSLLRRSLLSIMTTFAHATVAEAARKGDAAALAALPAGDLARALAAKDDDER